MGQVEFVYMGPLSRDFEFSVAACGVKKRVNSLQYLAGWQNYESKRWFTTNELEMPDIPWFTVDERI